MKKESRVLAVFISIIVGFVCGSIVLLFAGHNPIIVFGQLFKGVVNSPSSMSYTLIRMAPLVLTGVAAAFAFQSGLFNIGLEGQFIIGSLAATLVGFYISLPPILHALVAMLAAVLAAGLYGALVGFLKAKFNINEVISSIMFNWIALYLNNYFLTFPTFLAPNSDYSYAIQSSSSIRILEGWKTSESGMAYLQEHSFLQSIFKTPVNLGLFIAVIIAFAVWYLLKYTTLGFELKAVGFNKEASKFGGISISKKIVQAMFISGAIAGLAGAVEILGVSHRVGILTQLQGYGFEGIAISLIALNNPIMVIPSALFFAALNYGGGKLTLMAGVPSEIVEIMIGFIVFFVSVPFVIKLYKSKNKDRDDSTKKNEAKKGVNS